MVDGYQAKAARRSRIARFMRAREGNVTIEFAFIAPLTLLLVSGLIEFGLVTYDGTSLENAARAGAQYAFSGGYNEEKVSATVRSASTLTLSPESVSSTLYCECTDGTSITCGEPCANGGPNRRFIRVDVSKPHEAFLPFMEYLVPDQVQASATLRMQ